MLISRCVFLVPNKFSLFGTNYDVFVTSYDLPKSRLLLSRDVVDKIAMRASFSGVLLIFEQSHFTRNRALIYAHLCNHRVTVNNGE